MHFLNSLRTDWRQLFNKFMRHMECWKDIWKLITKWKNTVGAFALFICFCLSWFMCSFVLRINFELVPVIRLSYNLTSFQDSRIKLRFQLKVLRKQNAGRLLLFMKSHQTWELGSSVLILEKNPSNSEFSYLSSLIAN